MRVSLLGPVTARDDDGAPLDAGGARLRALLARLALDAGRVVPAGALITGLWDAEAPANAANALQGLVSRLRRALGADVPHVDGGYRLSGATVDAAEFEELAARGRAELAAGRVHEADATLTEALELWRGEALADVRDAPFALAPAVRLDGLRLETTEDRFEARLGLGRHTEILADLAAATVEHPLRERPAALRMRALQAAGRTAEALTVYAELRERLAERLGADPSPELRAAHLELLRGEERAATPTAGRLPVRLTSFVGREPELAALTGPASRLTTIVGPGGAGKTRLAVEAAARHPAHAAGRVWFAPLAGVGSPDRVPDAVLAALGHGLRRDGTPAERVAALLGPEPAVLVLDNCEHVIAAVAALAEELLERAPGLTILATSREPLAVTGEVLCPLGPLDPADEARRLFTDRARAVRPGFDADEGAREAVAEICRRLDGLPLALELAAARLRSMSAEQIARRLDDRFRLLAAGSRTAVPRHRTLQAVVEWSWDLLAEPERVLARRLSAFPGGARLADLEAVAAGPELPAADVIYVLGSLVEKSVVDADGGADPRYRMLETVRAYAAGRLTESGERAAVEARFIARLLAVAEENEPHLRTGEQLRALAVFEAEDDNMSAALRLAVDGHEPDSSARLIGALAWFWQTHRPDRRLTTQIRQILAVFGDELPEHARAGFAAVAALSEGTPILPATARALVDECVRTGAFERYPALVAAVPTGAMLAGDAELADRELRRAAGHPDAWVRAVGRLMEVTVRGDRGDWAGAAAPLAEAIERFTALGDRLGLMMALSVLARRHSVEGDHARAIAEFERAAGVAAETGPFADVWLRTQAAGERVRAGDLDGAERDFTALLARLASGPPERVLEVRLGLVNLHLRRGDLAAAEAAVAELTGMLQASGHPPPLAKMITVVARMGLRLAARDASGARELWPPVVVSCKSLRDFPLAAELYAALLAAEGDAVGAARALGWSERLRGAFDAGNPDLAELVADLTARLGEEGYRAAYATGTGASRDEVARTLA
ncbi:SARP family transcriptional regulator [Actinorhabdospora filicis]|uniref:SARP family transcriptional regulator n=1 Tax=Actinorhabdospora filicis TaxID=1785913 RepID=A0A9W6SSK9_9ACTN|nr:BTAD domain-containing putative transcriptional regulator [Actinorhabdospora filicis]GLZ81588.1 SARP family transcriptional regulator [Actinorhabdospora filicis]